MIMDQVLVGFPAEESQQLEAMEEEGQVVPQDEGKCGSTTYHLPSDPNQVLRQLAEAVGKQQWTATKSHNSNQPAITTSNQYQPLENEGQGSQSLGQGQGNWQGQQQQQGSQQQQNQGNQQNEGYWERLARQQKEERQLQKQAQQQAK